MATSRYALSRQGSGIIIATVFGALWAAWANPLFTRAPQAWFWVYALTVAAISTVLLAAGIAVIRRGSRLPRETSNAIRRRIRRNYIMTVVAEIVALNIAANLLITHHMMSYLPAAFAVIVGLHFFPLAWIFRMRHYHATAALMTLAGTLAILALVDGAPADIPGSLAAAACALVLWGSAALSWWQAHNAITDDATVPATLPATQAG
ncbi:MAG: DUF7010 family protein [Rhodanobacteraceae bacterium]